MSERAVRCRMLVQGLRGDVRAQHSVDTHSSALVEGPGTDRLAAARQYRKDGLDFRHMALLAD